MYPTKNPESCKSQKLTLWPAIAAFVALFSFTAHAQQHQPDLQWMTLKTLHFSVHYPAGFEDTAQKIALICEEVYQPVSESLNYFPHRTQVVVHTRSDISNGFVVQLPWRMELFINEPQDNMFGSNEDWLRILITHEMTHIVQARKVRGLSLLSYPFFGELNSFWHNVTPNWYVEGFATLNETRLTHGGRGHGAFFQMKMLAPLLNEKPWSLSNTSFSSRNRLPGDMSYVTGHDLSAYIAEKHGEQAWARILDHYTANPLPGFGNAVKKVTGKKPEGHYREMLAQYKFEKDTSAKSWQIWRQTDTPENQYSPRWDGKNLIFYRSSYNALPEIARIETDGTLERIAQRGLFGTESALAVSENWVVWAELKNHARFNATQYAQLMALDRRTGAIRHLSGTPRLYSPDIAPDQQSVVAVQSLGSANRLVQVSLADGAVTTLLELPGVTVLNPRWAPDGRSIAFVLKDSTFRQDIAILDLHSRDWRRLHKADSFHDNSPCWSPDGRTLFYTSDRTGSFNIWAIEIANGESRQVTDVATGAFSPDVSADGQRLVFTLYTELGFQIRTLKLQPEQWALARNAATSPQRNRDPAPRKVVIDSSRWQRTPYSPLGQILRPQGWIPIAVEDESGTAFGAFAISADALHKHDWNGFLALSPSNFKPSWDFTYNYRQLWPELTIRSFSDADEIGTLRDASGFLYDAWFRNTGVEFTAGVPLTLTQNAYTTFFRPMFGIKSENVNLFARGQSAGISGFEVKNELARYRGWKAGLQFFHAGQALRDIVPRKAFILSTIADWSASFLKSNIDAQQVSSIMNAYFPALLEYHAWQFQLTYTARSGDLGFDSFRSYPIGQSDPGRRKLLRVKSAYHFPIAYSERQMPLIPLFIHGFSGALFFDWGTSWNHGNGSEIWQANARSSSGVLLSAKITLFQTIATQIGLAGYYQDGRSEIAIEPIIGINF